MMVKNAESMYNQTHDPSGLVWVNHSGTDAVPNAVYAGKQADGQEVYVARSLYFNYLFSGKFVPGLARPFHGMYFSHDFSECKADTFQVLTNPNDVQIKWALGEKYRIQPTAVEAGCMGSYTLYIGRTKYQGNTVVGHVWPGRDTDENRLYYSMNGREHQVQEFEILLAKNPHDSQCIMNFQLNCCSTSCPKKEK